MECHSAVCAHVAEAVERLAELRIEEDLLVLRPACGISVAADGDAVHGFCQCLCSLVPASAVLQVENDCCRITCRERITVQADT